VADPVLENYQIQSNFFVEAYVLTALFL
jgi:hypothetical protein